MGTTEVWMPGLSLPGAKRRVKVHYINLELPPFQTQSFDLDRHSLSDSSDEELYFSDDDDYECDCSNRHSESSAQNDTPSRGLETSIGDVLRLSSSDSKSRPKTGLRWTTSARGRRSTEYLPRWRQSTPYYDPRIKLAYLSKDGTLHGNDPSESYPRAIESIKHEPVELHPHSITDILDAADTAWRVSSGQQHPLAVLVKDGKCISRQLTETKPTYSIRPKSEFRRRKVSRRSTAGRRRPHTVAPDVPRTSSSASTSAYVTDRVRYLLEARASITPKVISEDIIPLLTDDSGTNNSKPTASHVPDLEKTGISMPAGVLKGKDCRRFRRKVLGFIRQKRIIDSMKKSEKADAFIRFKTAGRIVLNLIHLHKAIIANTDDMTTKSAAEVQWQALYSDQDPHKFAFNASIFTRERAIEKLPMWALDLLRKDPELRTESDCRKLHIMLKGMRCYDKFTEKIQFALCKTFSLMCFQEGRVIIRQGHVGQNFYMIYSGSVFVNVNDKNAAGDVFVKNEAVLSKGDSFGELALLQDIRRTATIVVRETCELLVVQKSVFSQVCPRIFEIELEEKVMYMNKMLLFSTKWWTTEALKNLALTAQIQEYKSNKVIVSDSVTEDWFYICIEGKCQVIRCLELNKKEDFSTKANRRRSVVLLSDEILNLLGSFQDSTAAEAEHVRRQSSLKTPGSNKEKLLSSLGLDYIETGRRQKSFIAEMEQAEQKKALEAVRGHMTLTSFMKSKLKDTDSDLVFLHVGEVNPMEIFDLSCVLSPYHRTGGSSFMLVSGGAKVLRIRRDHFHDYASPAAMEYTKNQGLKTKYPSDETLARAYKEKAGWEKFKSSIVRDVKSARPILQDRSKFYKRNNNVKDRQSQIWTFVADGRIVELKTLSKVVPVQRQPTSAAVARVWAHDHRPEVVRKVPENIVMRRRSSVSFADVNIIQRARTAKSDSFEDLISDDEETQRFNKGKRKSVTIKLPSEVTEN